MMSQVLCEYVYVCVCVIEREEERERESRVYGPSYFGGKKAEEIFRKDSNHFLNTHTHSLSKSYCFGPE